MKLTIIMAIVLTAFSAFAFDGSIGSGEKTVDSLIYSNPCYITGVYIITNGTNDAKVIIYDNTTAAGTVRWEQTVAGTDNYGGRDWSYPKRFDNGIYVDVTGTGASYIIEYIKTDR